MSELFLERLELFETHVPIRLALRLGPLETDGLEASLAIGGHGRPLAFVELLLLHALLCES